MYEKYLACQAQINLANQARTSTSENDPLELESIQDFLFFRQFSDMKRYSPYIFGTLGLALIGFSFYVRNGLPGAEAVITNLSSVFMLLAGAVCVVVGIITFIKRNDPEEW